MNIANIPIGRQHKPFIIAEMSGNHNQSLDRALQIVDAAADAGADAIKLQTYTADTMTLDISKNEFFIEDPNSLWAGQSLHKLYQQAYTPWEWHEAIFSRAKKHNLLAFSSPFDATAVDFLEELNVPLYKIASFEITDIPLIKKVAATGKPLIISTGMATVSEIEDAVNAARAASCQELILLKCTSTYPASPENTNIATIPHLRDMFQCEVGLSDHTMGVGVSVASIALGATVIEKHFTLDRADGGVDASFSLEPAELKSLVIETERAWQAMGTVKYGTEHQEKSLVFRRSLYITENMQAGDLFTPNNLKTIRPGLGLAPKYIDCFMGNPIGKAVEKGTALTWELLIKND